MKFIGYLLISMLVVQGISTAMPLILENVVTRDFDAKRIRRALTDSKVEVSSKSEDGKD